MAKKKAAKKAGKGGARSGAGRPRINLAGSVKITLNLPVEIVTYATQTGLSVSQAIAEAVKASPQYRIWQGETSGQNDQK